MSFTAINGQAVRAKKLMRRVILNTLDQIDEQKCYDWFFRPTSNFAEICHLADWDKEYIRKKVKQKFEHVEKRVCLSRATKITWEGQTLSCLEWSRKKKITYGPLHNRWIKRLENSKKITMKMVFAEEPMPGEVIHVLDRVFIEYENKTLNLRAWMKERDLTASCILNRYRRYKNGVITVEKLLHIGVLPGRKR